MKKTERAKDKKERVFDLDSIDWFLAIDGCLA
jgi:hypothetical protein